MKNISALAGLTALTQAVAQPAATIMIPDTPPIAGQRPHSSQRLLQRHIGGGLQALGQGPDLDRGFRGGAHGAQSRPPAAGKQWL